MLLRSDLAAGLQEQNQQWSVFAGDYRMMMTVVATD
jgi:hypothetical protein